MKREPPVIDHDPDEPPLDRTGNWPYWVGFALLAVLWIGNLALFTLDWHSIVLGAATGGIFVAIVLDYTGNRVPKWMRR